MFPTKYCLLCSGRPRHKEQKQEPQTFQSSSSALVSVTHLGRSWGGKPWDGDCVDAYGTLPQGALFTRAGGALIHGSISYRHRYKEN